LARSRRANFKEIVADCGLSGFRRREWRSRRSCTLGKDSESFHFFSVLDYLW